MSALDHHGDRIRWKIGDLYSEGERDAGGFGKSASVGVDFDFGIDTGEFDRYDYTDPRPGRRIQYVAWSISACLIRWGMFVSVRGRRYQ